MQLFAVKQKKSGPVDFAEKTYESQLVIELAGLCNARSHHQPSQPEENTLGYDFAGRFIFNPFSAVALALGLNPLLSYSGITLSEVKGLGEYCDHHYAKARLNLFVQVKRPCVMRHWNCGEWSIWKAKYFRFKITQHQQDRLEAIHNHAGSLAKVIYASPAFETHDELSQYGAEKRVILKSNFPDVAMLSGHAKCSYKEPGNFCYGHSEPRPIESELLEDALNRTNEPMMFTDYWKRTSKLIVESVSNLKGTNSDYFSVRSDVYLAAGIQADSELRDTWFCDLLDVFAYTVAFGTLVIPVLEDSDARIAR